MWHINKAILGVENKEKNNLDLANNVLNRGMEQTLKF